MKNYYSEKVNVCKELSSLNVKHVNRTHILTAANKIGIPFASAQRAWKIFQETGGKKVDRRGIGTGRTSFCTTGEKAKYTKERCVSLQEACTIILEYMNTNIKAIALCNKYRITPNQFYRWIHELNVSGTILGIQILNPKRYAKVEILDVIRIAKRPDTKKKSVVALTDLERAAYERVGTVLKKYLSHTASCTGV